MAWPPAKPSCFSTGSLRRISIIDASRQGSWRRRCAFCPRPGLACSEPEPGCATPSMPTPAQHACCSRLPDCPNWKSCFPFRPMPSSFVCRTPGLRRSAIGAGNSTPSSEEGPGSCLRGTLRRSVWMSWPPTCVKSHWLKKVSAVMSKKSSESLSTQLKTFVAPFRVDGSGEFHLKSHRTNEKGGLDKDKAEKILEANRKRLNDFQEKLYAQDRWSLLLIFQGMDAAGKDSAIKSIFDGVNPQGCEVTSFKQPSTKELDHDFMWRSMIALPERGRIGTVILKFFLNVSREEQRERFLERLEDPAKNWKFSLADIGERKLWDKYQ